MLLRWGGARASRVWGGPPLGPYRAVEMGRRRWVLTVLLRWGGARASRVWCGPPLGPYRAVEMGRRPGQPGMVRSAAGSLPCC